MNKGWFVLFALAGLVSGCGSAEEDPSTATPGGALIEQDALVETMVREVCGALGSCCKASNFLADSAKCETDIREDLGASMSAQSGMPNRRYSAKNATDCVNARKARIASCQGSTPEAEHASCSGIFEGTIPEGSPCALETDDCAPGLYCSNKDGKVCVKLHEPTPLGGDCDPPGMGSLRQPSCAEGLTCGQNTHQCEELPEEGKTCTGFCKSGSYCDGATSVCKRAAAQGEACNQGSPSPAPCADTLKCNAQSNTCEPPSARAISKTQCENFSL